MRHKGFTLIEIIIVVVVIGILVSITIVAYSGSRERAVDTKIKSIVKTAGEAVQLHETKTNARITGMGYFSVAGGVDSLVPDYLNTDYRADVRSRNIHTGSVDHIFRIYPCTVGGEDKFVIYASLNLPQDQDVTKFNATRTQCSHSETQAPTSGAQVYNYARLF